MSALAEAACGAASQASTWSSVRSVKEDTEEGQGQTEEQCGSDLQHEHRNKTYNYLVFLFCLGNPILASAQNVFLLVTEQQFCVASYYILGTMCLQVHLPLAVMAVIKTSFLHPSIDVVFIHHLALLPISTITALHLFDYGCQN